MKQQRITSPLHKLRNQLMCKGKPAIGWAERLKSRQKSRCGCYQRPFEPW